MTTQKDLVTNFLSECDCQCGALLPQIFEFDQLSEPEQQSNEQFNHLLKMILHDFRISVLEGQAGKWSQADKTALLSALEMLDGPNRVIQQVMPYPSYGCLVVCHQKQIQCYDRQHNWLEIIGLDKFKFHVQSCQERRQFVSCPDEPSVLTVSPVPSTLLPQVHRRAEMLIKKAQQSSVRSAAFSEKGHQRTPAFIHSVYEDAVRFVSLGEDIITQPRGAFTDVGQHTGGRPRNTSWPLVQALLRYLLKEELRSKPDLLFHLTMAQLEIWLLERQLHGLKLRKDPVPTPGLDALAQMLRSFQDRVKALTGLDKEFQDSTIMDNFVERIECARALYDDALKTTLASSVHQFRLPEKSQRKAQLESHFSDPQMNIPTIGGSSVPQWTSEQEICARVNNSLGAVPLFKTSTEEPTNLRELLKYLKKFEGRYSSDLAWKQLAVGAVEKNLLNLASSHLIDSPRSPPLLMDDLKDLEKLMIFHMDTIEQLLRLIDTKRIGPLNRVGLESRATLILWIAYCLVHQSVDAIYPGLQISRDFSTPLDYSNLRNLALGNKPSWKAIKKVVHYLHKRSTGEYYLFSFNDDAGLYELADRFYTSKYKLASEESIHKIAQLEVEKMQEAQDKHWNVVKERKKEADRLKDELSKIEKKLWQIKNSENQAEIERNLLYGQKASLEGKISYCLKPYHLFQPLPEATEDVGRILFFLRMPYPLMLLAMLGFKAQQKLGPGKKDNRKFYLDYMVYHEKHHHGNLIPKTSWPDSRLCQPPTFHFPTPLPQEDRKLDTYYSRDVGVFYPPAQPMMAWCGCDPFSVVKAKEQEIAEKWTPTSNLQSWIRVLHDGSNRKRGNYPVAKPEEKPTGLSKEAYIQLCGIRAFPLQQMRNVCRALREDALPLENPSILTLLEHTLFHIGEIKPEKDRVELVWKRDFINRDVRAQLWKELDLQASVLANSSSRYEALLSVIDITTFVASFDDLHVQCSSVLRKLAIAADRMASDEKQLISKAVCGGTTKDSEICRMHAKRYVLLAFAILCFRSQKLQDHSDVEMMCCLIVQLHHELNLSTSNSLKQCRIAELARQLDKVVAEVLSQHHLGNLITTIDDGILTSAVRSVVERLGTEPLVWKPTKQGLDSKRVTYLCWETTHNGDTYHINLLNGVVLINGLPLERLPNEIRSDPMYVRTFGDRSFEVELCSDQRTFRTLKPISGAFYEFTPPSGSLTKKLKIVEVLSSAEVRRELLPDVDQWGKCLPLQLRMMHSFWREDEVVLVRGVTFEQRNLSFVLRPSSLEPKKQWSCCQVLVKTERYQDVNLEQCDQLMVEVCKDATLSTLGKLEDPKFIHVYRCPESSNQALWKFHIPRFGLHIVLTKAGTLMPLDYLRGYELAAYQQLDTLPNFQRYLVLQRIESIQEQIYEGQAPAKLRLLTPEGIVHRPPQQVKVDIKIHGEEDPLCANLPYITFDWDHRFLQFRCSTISARLQLAALHAASSTYLPEPRLRMTGSAMAIKLMRQCWAQKPFGKDELAKLANVAQFAQRAPALKLQCFLLDRNLHQLAFLYPSKENPDDPQQRESSITVPFDGDAKTEYKDRMERGEIGLQYELDPEESRLLNLRLPDRSTSLSLLPGSAKDELVEEMEEMLSGFCSQSEPSPKKETDCPVLLEHHPTALGQHFSERYKRSWEQFNQQPVSIIRQDQFNQLQRQIPYFLGRVEQSKLQKEAYLKNMIIGEGSTAPSAILRMERAADTSATETTPADWVTSTWLPHSALLQRLNPRLSDRQCINFRCETMRWLQLCVLHDRLNRIRCLLEHCSTINHSGGRNEQEGAGGNAHILDLLVRELLTRREWSIERHAFWLIFEAESGLQVRPEQYRVAMQMIRQPKAIVQLKTGEGKTRVILPLLVLHHTAQARTTICKQAAEGLCGEPLVRLIFLPQLLEDAYRHLHLCLGASALFGRLSLVHVPFHRDVSPQPEDLLVLKTVLRNCRRSGGALLVTPVDVLSMHLKCDELFLKHQSSEESETAQMKTRKALREVLDCNAYTDIIDECDEALRHTYQLIYSTGEKSPLPDSPSRWLAAQAVLRIMHRASSQVSHEGLEWDGKQPRPLFELGKLLRRELECREDTLPGSFGAWHFHQNEASIEGEHLLRSEFYARFVECLFDEPPREFDWLKEFRDNAELKRWIIDGEANLSGEQIALLAPGRLNDALVFRGILGMGVLSGALKKRSRVNYGIDKRRKKRLAVPFGAHDTPSDRSEFAHTDLTMLLTHLAYYDVGLSEAQLTEAVKTLLSLGPEERRVYYSRWLDGARAAMTESQWEQLSEDRRIDLTNFTQRQLLSIFFRKNVETINFWLDKVVLFEDTVQFKGRLTATPWMLVDDKGRQGSSSSCCGFSGTNDNDLLLPLQITTHNQPVDTTNGRMLSYIERYTDVVIVGGSKDKPLWQEVLEVAVSKNIHADAFIDVGALLVGVTTREAARFVINMERDQSKGYKGAVFSTVTQGHQEWRVMACPEREWALAASPIHERDSFVLFDQQQCRGADMKLRRDAVAALTVAPRLCMDSLIQAAGRMRHLGRGQRLVCLLPKAVALDIERDCQVQPGGKIEVEHVIRWALANTVISTNTALYMWAQQGLHFVKSAMKHMEEKSAPPLVEQERLTADELYREPFDRITVAQGVASMAAAVQSAAQPDKTSSHHLAIVAQIIKCANKYGSDVGMPWGSRANEECEREHERQRMLERETEEQARSYPPAEDVKWDLSAALSAPILTPNLDLRADIEPLSNVLRKIDSQLMTPIGWDRVFGTTQANGMVHVYCTSNFKKPLADACSSRRTTDSTHMHVVDAYLFWPESSQLLLLSPSELDDALEAFTKKEKEENSPGKAKVVLGHLTYAKLAADESSSYQSLCIPPKAPCSLPTDILAALQLLNGDTKFGPGADEGDGRHRALEELLVTTAEAARQAKQLPLVRGKGSKYSMSHLERTVKKHE